MNAEDNNCEIEISCELCKNTIKLIDSLAGSFDRICKACFGHQVEELYEPAHLIADFIYLGNEDAHRNEQWLTENGIGAILTCAKQIKPHEYKNLKVQSKWLDFADHQSQSILSHFDETNKWIEEMVNLEKKVFIHCAAGVSRSGSMTIAYFMSKKHLTFKQAFLFVKSKRKCVKPNEGFRKQLIKYEAKLHGEKQEESK